MTPMRTVLAGIDNKLIIVMIKTSYGRSGVGSGVWDVCTAMWWTKPAHDTVFVNQFFNELLKVPPVTVCIDRTLSIFEL